jgi:hypothetical protein
MTKSTCAIARGPNEKASCSIFRQIFKLIPRPTFAPHLPTRPRVVDPKRNPYQNIADTPSIRSRRIKMRLAVWLRPMTKVSSRPVTTMPTLLPLT